MVNNYSLFRKSDCGTVGRAVASNPRGLRLQSRYWHLLQNICSMSVVKKKERRGRDGSLNILLPFQNTLAQSTHYYITPYWPSTMEIIRSTEFFVLVFSFPGFGTGRATETKESALIGRWQGPPFLRLQMIIFMTLNFHTWL